MRQILDIWRLVATKYLNMAFNGRFILNMISFAARQGLDPEPLIQLTGQSKADLGREDSVVANEVYNAVCERAVAGSKDPFFGLHMGESMNLSAAGLIAQISQTSETVRQALEFCCQFANLGCSVLPMSLEKEKDRYRVVLRPDPVWESQAGIAVRHTAEGVLAFSLREFHTLTFEKYQPLEVHFPWPAPTDESEYHRIFACPLRFGAREIGMVLHAEHVNARVVTSNYDLLRILVAHAEKKSAQIQGEKGFSTVVKQTIIRMVKPEFPSLHQVAKSLNLSPRTLQRRLQAEGLTYSTLSDELKKEFALSYLSRPDLSVGEVAYLLDYSEPSTFTRSFKRWMGMSPMEYKTQLEKEKRPDSASSPRF